MREQHKPFKMSKGKAKGKGLVFNIQRYSLQDGPGIRTTVFLKGCTLRCSWCSNPESQAVFPEILNRRALCTKCELCIGVCPVGAISLGTKGVRIGRKACTNCLACVSVCYPGALKIAGTEMSVEEVFNEVVRDEAFYRNSGGGVTLSGGEPLLQPDFALPFLQLCREAGLHTTIDTCGHVDPPVLERVLDYTDLVLYDLKHMDHVMHKKLTGVSNELILNNLRSIAGREVPHIIRFPIIPDINDSEENIRAMVSLVAGLSGVGVINLLPYHRLGMGKYDMLSHRYKLGALPSATTPQVEKVQSLIEQLGWQCEIVV
ncbi:glycyl-radical enzyme activating protein [Chloroflexota bacterium]